MQHDGLFIVLEGIDGTGKTTQRAMLRERLDKLGYEVAIFDFPRYGNASGYFVKQYLNGEYGSLEQVGPYTAALFYTLDRYDAASEIKKAILQGKIVIADRFVGSNMAHQGAKINHPEERRGFFLWLDTLEFRMMNIPRPDRSIVLELPADQAQVRVDQKQQRAYTNKTRDLHEASLEHLRQTANAYHDLCQLFPRDFIGIDCFRNNTQLTVEQIGEIIWDKIEPLLPTLPPKPADVPTVSAEPEEQTPPTKRASLLAAAANNAVTLPVASGLEVPTFYTPVYFDAKTKQTYVEQMTKLYQAHSSIAGKLKAFAPNGQALPEQTIRDLAQLTLPVATIVPVKADARELQPSPKTNDKRPAYLEAATELQKNYSDESERANLVSYWPRNEMDLVPAVLYEGSNQSLGEIQRAVSTWPYDKKVAIIHSYIADPNDDKRALDSVTYAWDIDRKSVV